ncbi:hypothetical protein FA13DRAFT_1729812, partial [Coprinellus micaceus]
MMNVTFLDGGEASPQGFAQPPPPAAPPSSSTEEMEADLRARVLKSRRLPKPGQLVPSPSSIPDSSVLSKLTPNAPPPPEEPVPSPQMEDAVSFIAETLGVSVVVPTSKPPPPLRTNSAAQVKDLAAQHQRLEQDIAERKSLMDRLLRATTKAEKDAIFALLREKDRASKETEVKPSAKINLDYVPTPQLPRWPSHQQRTVLEISDDEEDEEDD